MARPKTVSIIGFVVIPRNHLITSCITNDCSSRVSPCLMSEGIKTLAGGPTVGKFSHRVPPARWHKSKMTSFHRGYGDRVSEG